MSTANVVSLSLKSVKSLLIPMLVCVVLAVILKVASVGKQTDVLVVQQWLSEQGIWGWVVLSGAAVMLMLVGFPRQIVAFISGSLLGISLGALLSTGLAATACAITFVVSRRLLQRLVSSRFPTTVSKLHPLLKAKPYSTTLAIRLFPLGSNAITNIVAGASTIKGRQFVSASALGYLPQMLTFALMGQGIEQVSGWHITISLCLLISSVLLGAHLYRWYQQQSVALQSSELKDNDPSA